MRYLGNKTKLLPAIEAVLRDRGVSPPGVFLDIFSGSNAVARRMKRLGFSVIANDHLVCSATQARATIALERSPRLRGVVGREDVQAFLSSGEGRAAVLATPPPEGALPDEIEASAPLREVIAYLNRVAPVEGLIFRQYSAGGAAERRFFTADVGRAIDGVRATIALWKREGSLAPKEEPVLLAALLDAVDRCANISGTYGAFLKKWQTNSRGPLTLRAPLVIPGASSESFCKDANALVGEVDAQVLYLDPPYNRRQYAKNYHVLEIVAELAAVEDEAAYEAGIYGVTGLREFDGRKSAYCMGSVRGAPSPCEQAFTDLIRDARAEHILISYNEEGILSREVMGRILARECPGFDANRDFVEVSHKRFRSDKDEAARRQYRVLENRKKDEVREWLVYARKPEVSLQALRARRVRVSAGSTGSVRPAV